MCVFARVCVCVCVCMCVSDIRVFVLLFVDFVVQKSTVTLKDVGGIDHCLQVSIHLQEIAS